jgi:5-methylthioribose kinase
LYLDDTTLPTYLRRIGVFAAAEDIRVEPAGEGNINYVRRVRGASGRSFVVKHARARLERFPEYAATPDRILFEHRFWQVVAERMPSEAGVLPAVFHFDEVERVLVMEDLGSPARLQEELLAGRVDAGSLRGLGEFLGALHRATAGCSLELVPRFRNDEMRALHGEHIFTLPFEPNGFAVPEILRVTAERHLARLGLRKRIAQLRASYYGSAGALIHADAQGGNVLLAPRGPRLLDAEIAHVGDPAFDLGTALAHVELPLALDASRDDARDALLAGYRAAGGSAEAAHRAAGYAGVEMLRRIIGAAQVPLRTTEHGVAALDRAVELLES